MYVLLVERKERQYLADRTGSVTAVLSAGAEEFTPDPLDERLDAFVDALKAEPVRLSDRDRAMQEFELMLGGGGGAR